MLGIVNESIQKEEIAVGWHKPASGWVKLNCDGARKRDPVVAACGGLIRDCDGAWVGGFCRFLGVASVLKAEAWGLLEGIRLASYLALDSLDIECDSKVLVDAVNGGAATCPEIRNIVEDVHCTLLAFRRWRVNHVWREANSSADCLAQLGCGMTSSEVVRFREPPPKVLRLLREDGLGSVASRLVRDDLGFFSV